MMGSFTHSENERNDLTVSPVLDGDACLFLARYHKGRLILAHVCQHLRKRYGFEWQALKKTLEIFSLDFSFKAGSQTGHPAGGPRDDAWNPPVLVQGLGLEPETLNPKP